MGADKVELLLIVIRQGEFEVSRRTGGTNNNERDGWGQSPPGLLLALLTGWLSLFQNPVGHHLQRSRRDGFLDLAVFSRQPSL